MKNNILEYVADYCHIPNDEIFETQLLALINAAILDLSQTIDTPLNEVTNETTWDDLLGDRHELFSVKSYISIMVMDQFDPPTAVVKESNKLVTDRILWRLTNMKI